MHTISLFCLHIFVQAQPIIQDVKKKLRYYSCRRIGHAHAICATQAVFAA